MSHSMIKRIFMGHHSLLPHRPLWAIR
jgi:hypothetical protein